ncbi:sulfurtransferase [Mycetocola tolaasinivorans]|uniref:Sulfurtransferase n=1 Tax=Mycetocola tolaasinivorans TaxID=76635 RepID=A0A3L7A172_9MICO|nr:sulfurtransferase [Mycetocola tolaasinivorans]RLP73715.1 sulfurtransferase [Mycetocola tolaasinivorans]
MSNLISAAELAALLETDAPVRVLDVRWRLDKPDGHEDYLAGHIPGAVFVNLDTELADPQGDPALGRHPLPTLEILNDAVARWGINPGDTVVAYDTFASLPSARAWWVLADAGFTNVRVLDGGLAAWQAENGTLDTGEVRPEAGSLVLTELGHNTVLDADGAAALAASGVLIDSRAGERFRGETEPMDPRAGHIPGAVNVPSGTYLENGHFLAPEKLREVFAAVGATAGAEIGTTCGSGITAAHTALALSEAGLPAAIFAGSWSAWSRDPERPVAVGA